jgi:cardiolipin synthase
MQVSVYICLTWLSLIPVWLLLAVIFRDLLIIAGGLYYYYRVEKVNAAPSLISKLNTLMQILLVIIILLHKSLFELPIIVLDIIIYSVLATTVLSGMDYVITWSRKAWQIKKG